MLECLCLVTELLIISETLNLVCATANCATLNYFKCHISRELELKPETCYARE